MNILLISPPLKNMILTNVPLLVEEGSGIYPPLGLMYLASHLEENSEHKIEILDTQVNGLSYTEIEGEIKTRKPDLVGIQAMTPTIFDTLLTAKIVKKIDPEIKVVLGGPHVSIYPNETMNFPEIDYIVLGEGEITFTELVQNLDDKVKLHKTKGIILRDNGDIITTGRRELIKELDMLPFPARHLTPYKRYYSLLAKRSPITTMITSRGCPYNCLYCNRRWLGKKFRARTPGNVVDEIEECTHMGITEFFIYDDTFTVDRNRVFDMCREILDRNLDILWDVRTRVDLVDEGLIKIMKKAGCERIHYGVESGNSEILNVLRKGITIEQAEKAFRITKDAGLTTLAYFMMGSPRETRAQIKESIELAKKLNPDFVHFSVTTPFPDTDLYYMGLREGILERDYWREFAENPTRDFQPHLWKENLTREELIALLNHAYKSFYIRPTYIVKELLKISSLEEFERKIKAGLNILRL